MAKTQKLPKFLVYIVTPEGKKTRGTAFNKERSAINRVAKLLMLVSSRYTVVLYNVHKRRVQRMETGYSKRVCLLAIPYAYVAYQ